LGQGKFTGTILTIERILSANICHTNKIRTIKRIYCQPFDFDAESSQT